MSNEFTSWNALLNVCTNFRVGEVDSNQKVWERKLTGIEKSEEGCGSKTWKGTYKTVWYEENITEVVHLKNNDV